MLTKRKDTIRMISEKLSRKTVKLHHGSVRQLSFEDQLEEFKMQIFMEVNSCPFGCMCVDDTGRIEYCNEQICSIFKQDLDELDGLDINLLVEPDLREKHETQVEDFFKQTAYAYTDKQVIAISKEDQNILVNVGYMMKSFEQDDKKVSYCFCMIRVLKASVDKQLIMPESLMQIGWILFMFMFISITMILLPYEAVFNSEVESLAVNWAIYISTVFDIIFNFNAAQMHQGKIVTDRWTISYNQLLGQFIIDFQTGIPISFQMLFFNLNTQFIMGLKLLRGLKLVKQWYILNDEFMIEYLSKNPMFRRFKIFTEKYKLIQEALNLIGIILVYIHFMSAIWLLISQYQVIDNWANESLIMSTHNQITTFVGGTKHILIGNELIPQSDIPIAHEDWKIQLKNQPFEAQIKTQYEVASAVLMFKMLECFNIFEQFMSILLIFSGLTFMSQTVGRLTETLNFIGSESVRDLRVWQVMFSVASEAHLSDTMIEKLLVEVTKSAPEVNSESKHMLKEYIDPVLQDKMFKEYQNEQIENHMILWNINLNQIEILYKQSIFRKDPIVFEQGQIANSLIFLSRGKIECTDANDKLVHDFQSNELVGFQEFQFQIKKNVHIENMKEIDVDEGHVIAEKFETGTVNNRRNKNNENLVRYKLTALTSWKSDYFSISFQILEDIIKNDHSFYTMLEAFQLDDEKLPFALQRSSAKDIEVFNAAEECGLIFMANGDIYKVNQEFKRIFGFNEFDTRVADKTMMDLFQTVNDEKFPKLQSLTPGRHVFKFLGKTIDVDLTMQYKTMVINKERTRLTCAKTIKAKRDIVIVQFKMLNSIEAFLVGRQKAIKLVRQVLKQSQVSKGGTQVNVAKKPDELKLEVERNGLMKIMSNQNLALDDVQRLVSRYGNRSRRNSKHQLDLGGGGAGGVMNKLKTSSIMSNASGQSLKQKSVMQNSIEVFDQETKIKKTLRKK